MAWTYNQSAMILYFNGLPVITNAIGSQVIATSSTALRISGADTQHVYFDGEIDEASVYKTALSATQILAVYSAGSAGKCPSPPVIVSQPASDTLIAGGNTATFGVAAEGMRPLGYQWFLGTNAILAATNVTATNATLVVPNVQLGQSGGIYSVVVSNVLGSTNSSNAVLTVNVAASVRSSACWTVLALWSGEGNARDSVGMNEWRAAGRGEFQRTGEAGQAFSFDGVSGYGGGA